MPKSNWFCSVKQKSGCKEVVTRLVTKSIFSLLSYFLPFSSYNSLWSSLMRAPYPSLKFIVLVSREFQRTQKNTENTKRILPFCSEFSRQKKNLYLNSHSCGQAWPKLGSVPQKMLERSGTALLSLHWGHSPGFWFSSHCGQTLPDFKDVSTGHNHSWAGLDLLHVKSTIKWGEKMINPEQDVVQSPDFLRHCKSCILYTKLSPNPASSVLKYRNKNYYFFLTQRWTSKTHLEKAEPKSQLIVHNPESTAQKSTAARCQWSISSSSGCTDPSLPLKAKLLINCFST